MAVAEYVREALAGSSVIRKLFEEGAALKKLHGSGKVFDFSIGNPDLEPPPAFHETLVRLATCDAAGSHGYMPNAGYPAVREALSKKCGSEQGVTLNADDLVMSVGAAGGLNCVFKSIINPGDEVIVSKPYFMEYRTYIANHGGKLVEVDSLPDFNLDINAVRKALTPRTAAVMINTPHNPTGRVYPEETITALAAALNEYGKKSMRFPYLVSDEPYREIVYDNIEVAPVLCAYQNSIVVTSYSKSLSLPGERIGYIAVNPSTPDKQNLIAALIWATRVLGFVNAPALMQRCVAELTAEKVAVDIYAERRDAFIKVLDGAGLKYSRPQGAFYIFCKVPSKTAALGDDNTFSDHLKKYLILGVPGSGFAAPGWLRFAYCVSSKIISASADAFKKAVGTYL
ncbi:aspartate aminotransferase [Spirochaetia bacterium]|nr:aspartate aminotransferase [Spirochaetia bacterium]